MNDKFMNKEIEFFYYEGKYQLFSVASLEEANCQGKVCLRTLMTTLNHSLNEAKSSTRFECRFKP